MPKQTKTVKLISWNVNGLIEQGQVMEGFIDNDIPGSDHCPIGLVLHV